MGVVVDLKQYRRMRQRQALNCVLTDELEVLELRREVTALYQSIPVGRTYLEREQTVVKINNVHHRIAMLETRIRHKKEKENE